MSERMTPERLEKQLRLANIEVENLRDENSRLRERIVGRDEEILQLRTQLRFAQDRIHTHWAVR